MWNIFLVVVGVVALFASLGAFESAIAEADLINQLSLEEEDGGVQHG